jgi:hypothetical protein
VLIIAFSHPYRTPRRLPERLPTWALSPRRVLLSCRNRRRYMDRIHLDRVHPSRAQPREHTDAELRSRRRRDRTRIRSRFLVLVRTPMVHGARNANRSGGAGRQRDGGWGRFRC